MNVCVGLLADDVWADEYDKTGFLECLSAYFWSVIFERTTNFRAHGVNEYYKTKI